MRSPLVTKLQNMLREADVETSEVGDQRERNHRMYTLMPLGNEQRGRSHYVDPTVLSTVEGKKAVFSETFLSSRDVVKFSGADVEQSKAKDAYVQRVFKKNNYERLLRDAWHDAFVAKRCTVWASWERDTDIVELSFQGEMTDVVMQRIAELGNVVGVDDSALESTPIPSIGQPMAVHNGTVRVEVDASYVKLDLITPERVYRDPNADYPDVALYNAQEVEISKGQLIDQGYDPDQVNKLTRDFTYASREEDYARKAHDRSYGGDYGTSTIDEQEIVTVYKTRAWLTIEDGDIEDYTPTSGEMKLYEICWGSNEVLNYADGTPHVQELDEMNVYEWVEMKISHAESGMCTADVEALSQKNLSVLKRGVIDNMQMVNNTRYEAVEERLRNPRDLLDNAIGGVVWSHQIGSVAPLAQPPLSPLTLPIIEMLNRDAEERSGLSSLARGMNSDALSSQNAASMVERLTNAGTRRVTMAARDFANTFLVPLMQGVVRIGGKNDPLQDQMESGGRMVNIVPQSWDTDDLDMEITVALTPDEAANMAQRLMMMHQTLSTDPAVGPMYGINQRHALYDTLFELIGVKDATPFLLPPESPEFQQAMMQQQQEQQQMMMMQQQQAAAQQELIAAQLEVAQQGVMQQWAKINNDIMDTVHDNQRDDDKLFLEEWKARHDARVDNAELELEESQERAVDVG